MCGISFYCRLKTNPTDELQESLRRIAHRGPDAQGEVYSKIGPYHIGIGHHRLSILDKTAAAHQPMSVDDDIILAYNGEVYNHEALRQRLRNEGVALKTRSDTEVVLLLYQVYGTSSFELLNGMFAYVLLDKKRKKLYLVRDKIGIKPLYIYKDEQGLFASSEIRGLKAFSDVVLKIDHQDVFEFFNQGFLYEPSTGYQSIKKLMPGHYLEFDLTHGTEKLVCFNTQIDEVASNNLSEKISQVIAQQLVADVPLGTFFSGGIDSSILASYAKETDLFFATYDADEAHHDLKFSHAISNLLDKPLITSTITANDQTVDDLMMTVDFVAKNSEELISDYTFWATYQLSLAAQQKGYKVMLSGMGGDEIFAGYPRYAVLKKHRWTKLLYPVLYVCLKYKIFPKKLDKKFERLVSYSAEKHWPTAYARLLGYFSRTNLKDLFIHPEELELHYQQKLDAIALSFKGNPKDKVKFAQYFDLFGFLSHNLMVSDKASMLAGIELRVPLLAESIVVHGLGLSTAKLLKNGQLKSPLKSVLATLIPKQFTKRPKTGFNPPLDGLIRTIGLERLHHEMKEAKHYLNANTIEKLLEEHFSGVANHTYKLWQLLYFSRWLHVNEERS